MRPIQGLPVLVPTTLVIGPLAPAEARSRDDGGAADVAGLLGPGTDAIADCALDGHSHGYATA